MENKCKTCLHIYKAGTCKPCVSCRNYKHWEARSDATLQERQVKALEDIAETLNRINKTLEGV